MATYPPQRILVPVDFGPASARAAGVAAAIADRTGARLTALHAESIEAPPYFTTEQIDRLERERATARTAAERYATRFLREASGREMAVAIREEPPADAILHASHDADLIVMGTHGRRGPRRWWLGSVAERVVLHSAVPVLVVREAPAGDPGAIFSRVLCLAPASPGPGTAAVRRYAAGLAETFRGSVVELDGHDAAREARTAEGTLLVVPRPTAPDESWFGDVAERLLRDCVMPMLFVIV